MSNRTPRDLGVSVRVRRETILVRADVTVRSASGASPHAVGSPITEAAIDTYLPPDGRVQAVEELCRRMGFRVHARNRMFLTIAAPLPLFERLFGVRLRLRRYKPYFIPPGQRDPAPDAKGEAIAFELDGGSRLPLPAELSALVDTITLPAAIRMWEGPPVPPGPREPRRPPQTGPRITDSTDDRLFPFGSAPRHLAYSECRRLSLQRHYGAWNALRYAGSWDVLPPILCEQG